MSGTIANVRLNADALITPAPEATGGHLERRRGRAGYSPRSKTCGILDMSQLSSLSLSSGYGEIECPSRGMCAFSASYVGCAYSSTSSSSSAEPLPTTCYGLERWADELNGNSTIPPGTKVCTDYQKPQCQTLQFQHAENTFTGFACLPRTASSALTVTGGSWEAFPPTSIPTPIDDLYYIVTNTTTAIVSPTATVTVTATEGSTSNASICVLAARYGSMQVAILLMIVSLVVHIL